MYFIMHLYFFVFLFKGKNCEECLCENHGICTQNGCQCLNGYSGLLCTKCEGPRCNLDFYHNSMNGPCLLCWLPWVLAVVGLVAACAVAILYVLTKGRGRQFAHTRMEENVEITNPMYEGEDSANREFCLVQSVSIYLSLFFQLNLNCNGTLSF